MLLRHFKLNQKGEIYSSWIYLIIKSAIFDISIYALKLCLIEMIALNFYFRLKSFDSLFFFFGIIYTILYFINRFMIVVIDVRQITTTIKMIFYNSFAI